jgi:hypothetical protein
VQLEFFQPGVYRNEGALLGQVKHNAGCFRQLEVIVYYCAVALLPSRIPKFQVEGFVPVLASFQTIIDADGRFLGIELLVDVLEQKGGLPHACLAYDDHFVMLYGFLILHYKIQTT